jgi:predicted nucleotidyltransferase
MADIPLEVLDIAKEYLEKVKSRIPVDRAYLFGSYAKGSFNKDSDVDIAVFSPVFESMTRIEGLTLLLMLALGFDADLQPQPFTAQDFEEDSGMAYEIRRTGVELTV